VPSHRRLRDFSEEHIMGERFRQPTTDHSGQWNTHFQAAAQYQAAAHHHLQAAHHYEHGQHEAAMKHAESARSHGDMGHAASVEAAKHEGTHATAANTVSNKSDGSE
jgi:hypothetical protein